MTDETTENQAVNNDVQISVEQICAAILSIGPVVVPLENLIANYGGKTIAVNQDENTKAVTFALADMPETVSADNVLSTEQSSAE